MTQVVDAHAHVFRPVSVHPRPADELVPAERDAPAERLVTAMDAAGVDRTVLVPLDGDDTAVAEAVRAHPDRFTAVIVATAAEQGLGDEDPVLALDRRLERIAARGLRTMRLGDPGRSILDSPMLPALDVLADRGLVLWSYLPPEQTGLLAELAAARPELPIVLNHLGFAPHDMRVDAAGRPRFANPLPSEELDRIEALAEHRNVHLMVSGHYALSAGGPPYDDLADATARLVRAFGPERSMLASDWPWIDRDPGYASTLDALAALLPPMSSAELALVRGGTATALLDLPRAA